MKISKLITTTLIATMLLSSTGGISAFANTQDSSNNIKVINEISEMKTFSTSQEGIDSGLSEFVVENETTRTSGTTEKWELRNTQTKNNYDFEKHPNAKNSYYNVSAYYFDFNNKVTYNSSIGASFGIAKALSVSVSVGKTRPSGGYAVSVSQSRKSIPIARGTCTVKTYAVKVYDKYSGKQVGSRTDYGTTSTNVQGWYRYV